jgi:uncharacterized UBP type Zn finger protein
MTQLEFCDHILFAQKNNDGDCVDIQEESSTCFSLLESGQACIAPDSVVFSAEDCRAKVLENLKSQIKDLEKRPLLLFKQKNTVDEKGWLRKALYPDAEGPLSDSEEDRFYS